MDPTGGRRFAYVAAWSEQEEGRRGRRGTRFRAPHQRRVPLPDTTGSGAPLAWTPLPMSSGPHGGRSARWHGVCVSGQPPGMAERPIWAMQFDREATGTTDRRVLSIDAGHARSPQALVSRILTAYCVALHAGFLDALGGIRVGRRHAAVLGSQVYELPSRRPFGVGGFEGGEGGGVGLTREGRGTGPFRWGSGGCRGDGDVLRLPARTPDEAPPKLRAPIRNVFSGTCASTRRHGTATDGTGLDPLRR